MTDEGEYSRQREEHVRKPCGRREWGNYQGLKNTPLWLEQGEPEGAWCGARLQEEQA